jgi:hypothetical protein
MVFNWHIEISHSLWFPSYVIWKCHFSFVVSCHVTERWSSGTFVKRLHHVRKHIHRFLYVVFNQRKVNPSVQVMRIVSYAKNSLPDLVYTSPWSLRQEGSLKHQQCSQLLALNDHPKTGATEPPQMTKLI